MVTAAKIYHDYKDAIVLIFADGFKYTYTITEGIQLTTTKIDNQVTGFFIQEHYIVAPLNAISGVTQTLLGNTTFSSTQVYTSQTVTNAPELNNRINFYDLKVRVTNVNGSHCNVAYTPRVVGIDAARNLAVLRIDDLDAHNQGLIPLTCEHPYLTWGKSQDLCYGSVVFHFAASVSCAVVVDKTEVALPLCIFFGKPLNEFFLVDEQYQYPNHLGAPYVNKNGEVVGVALDYEFVNALAVPNRRATTQHQLQYIIDAIISGLHGPLGCHLTQTTLSNLGYPINIFIQPILGIKYTISKDGNSLLVLEDVDPDTQVPSNITAGSHLCSLCYCNDNYCLGVAKKHIQPIQVLFKATVGDVVVVNGVTEAGIPFQIPVVLQAPAHNLLFDTLEHDEI